jgi:hypothetical protein
MPGESQGQAAEGICPGRLLTRFLSVRLQFRQEVFQVVEQLIE